MDIALRFIAALIFFTALTYWLTRNSIPRLTFPQVIVAFAAKVMMGCLYGYVFLVKWGGDDTWMIHRDSLAELDKLLHRTGYFFEDINIFRLVREYGWQAGLKEFGEKLELALLIKPLALFNLVSGGNYYINVIAFSAITWWGHCWLYRLAVTAWPEAKKLAYWVIFLYPPVLFWLSGIRSDGWLFFFFGGLLWHFYRWLEKGGRRNLLVAVLCYAGMVVTRTPFAALLIPSLLAWWWCRRNFTRRVNIVYFSTHLAALLIFFLSGLLRAPYNLPEQMYGRQQAFFALAGNTRVPLDTLDPSPQGYLHLLPQAIDNIMVRPYPWHANGIFQYLTVIQNFFIICLIAGWAVLWLRSRRPASPAPGLGPVVALWLAFALSSYLSIGYTIPFPGALVRYRAIPELCLLLLLVLPWIHRKSFSNNIKL